MQQHRVFKSLTAQSFERMTRFAASRSVTLAESVTKSLSDAVDVEKPPKEQLRALVGKVPKYPEEIGTHPDFAHLEYGTSEYSYATTVFVDIKGSTLLATKLDLPEVRFLKDGIIKAAIAIFQAFDGHIHRIQGDAVMAYFRRKDMPRPQAVVDALNAATFLQMYINEELNPLFDQMGLPTLQIRIGVDFGDDPVVLWSKYGILNCSEITTTSLHTDLAAKLQSEAPANGIMVGDNVRALLDLPEEFVRVRTHQENGVDVLYPNILETRDLRYRMWQFDWRRYAGTFPFLPKESDFPYHSPEHFRLRCSCADPGGNGTYQEFQSNCFVLPKGKLLRFDLELANGIKCDDVEWYVMNRGEEARTASQLTYEMTNHRGKLTCPQSTKYTGHHYMRCTLYYQKRLVGRDLFGIYVHD